MSVSSALIALAALLGLAVLAGVVWRVGDGRRRGGAGTVDLAGLGVVPGRVTLVQFSTQTCARCPQVRRMLQGIASARADLDHVDVDLTHRPDLSVRHRVLSTPTTFVIGADAALVARFTGVPRRADVEAALSELPRTQETP